MSTNQSEDISSVKKKISNSGEYLLNTSSESMSVGLVIDAILNSHSKIISEKTGKSRHLCP